MKKHDVSDVILKFRDFLLAAWVAIDAILISHDWDNDPYLIEDWLSANWKLLVERQIAYLYDISVDNSFVVFCDVSRGATDMISSKPLPNHGAYKFKAFVSKKGNGFGIYPPFDIVELTDTTNDEVCFAALKDVSFFAAKED